MTEGEYWSKHLRPALLKESQLEPWVLWKHCDRFTDGILDFSLSLGKHTEWYELKIYPREETAKQKYYRLKIGDGAHLIVINANLCSYSFDGVSEFFDYPRRTVRSLSARIVMSTYE